MVKKLTKAQQRVWEEIKFAYQPGEYANQNLKFCDFATNPDGVVRYIGKGLRHDTLLALQVAGLIAIIPGHSVRFTLTDAGRAEIAQTAQPAAIAEPGTAQGFEAGDRVVIRQDAQIETPLVSEQMQIDDYRDNRVVGTVTAITDAFDPIQVQFPHDEMAFQPDELDLWKPDATALNELDTLKQQLATVTAERDALRAALTDIARMTRPVEMTETTVRYPPLLWDIHERATKALRDVVVE